MRREWRGIKQRSDFRLRTGGFSISSGRTEVGSDTEREEERALEEQGAEQHLEDLQRSQEETARIEEAIARDEHEREISDRTPEGEQGRVTWKVRVETT